MMIFRLFVLRYLEFYTASNFATLVNCLKSEWNAIRELSSDILSIFPEELSIKSNIKEMINISFNLLN